MFPVPLPTPRLPFLVHAENSSTDQRQACKKHELYVSFRDLGWQVRGVAGSAPWRGPPVLLTATGRVPYVQRVVLRLSYVS